MKSDKSEKLTGVGLWMLVLRVLVGWHFMYEGLVKLSNPNWTSVGYLMDSQGFCSELFYGMASNPTMLQFVDFMNVWGLIAIGAGLILGLFTRVALVSGIFLLGLYYLSHPPLLGYSYALPAEGSYLLVNKILIELVVLIALIYQRTEYSVGLDRLIFRRKSR